LVQSVGRQRWLWGRVGMILTVMIVAGLLSAAVVWLSMGGQHNGISFHDLSVAGLNALPAAIFILGVGIFALGVVPRLTTVITYGVIAWSFLVELLASGTNLNHWFLDTSVFNHVAFAPAADPKWGAGLVLIAIGAALAVAGAMAFNRRDLATE
jgi:ABC-2 type transport system permease protein